MNKDSSYSSYYYYYGISLWGSEIENIHKLQKRVLRIISDSKFNAHTGANLQRRATSKS